jgi:chromosome segregation ATPase
MEINGKKLENILNNQREEYQRYLGIVAEDFKSQVKTVAEGVEILSDKIDRVETRLDGVETRLDGVETRLDGVETNTEIIKTDIEFIKNNLKKKVDLEEFEALEKRVSFLEAKISK